MTTGTGSTYKCNCPSSYTGVNCTICKIIMKNIFNLNMIIIIILANPCSKTPCLNGGTCNANGTSYTCQCLTQYIGSNCDTCKYRVDLENFHHLII